MKVSDVAEELKGFGCNEDKVTKLLVKMGLLDEEKKCKYQIGDIWKYQVEKGEIYSAHIISIQDDRVTSMFYPWQSKSHIQTSYEIETMDENCTQLFWRKPK